MGQEASSTKHIGFHGLDREIGGGGGGSESGSSPSAHGGGAGQGRQGRSHYDGGSKGTKMVATKTGKRGTSFLAPPSRPKAPKGKP